MVTVRIRSLAKINLDLRVLNKRPDGYHNIRTVFHTVSLADTIELSYSPARRLTLELRSKPEIPGNLIQKAVEMLDIPGRFRIRLEKKIPMGGGLGGGSSNAAAMLLAIPAITGRRVPFERLIELGSQLGSDVPYFLFGGAALGLGRGAELYPLPGLKSYPAILVTPGIHVSTAAAYGAFNRTVETQSLPSPAALWNLDGPPSSWLCCNDFETVVFPEHPQLKLVKGKVSKAGADLALMSGSGSTLFGIFGHRSVRDAAVVSLRKDFGKDRVFPVTLAGRAAYRSLWWRQLRVPLNQRTWPPLDRYAR